jgi:hypothetical protein
VVSSWRNIGEDHGYWHTEGRFFWEDGGPEITAGCDYERLEISSPISAGVLQTTVGGFTERPLVRDSRAMTDGVMAARAARFEFGA